MDGNQTEEMEGVEASEDVIITNKSLETSSTCGVPEAGVEASSENPLDESKDDVEEDKKEGCEEQSGTGTTSANGQPGSESPEKDKSSDDMMVLVDEISKSGNVEATGSEDKIESMDFDILCTDIVEVEKDGLADSRDGEDDGKDEVEKDGLADSRADEDDGKGEDERDGLADSMSGEDDGKGDVEKDGLADSRAGEDDGKDEIEEDALGDSRDDEDEEKGEENKTDTEATKPESPVNSAAPDSNTERNVDPLEDVASERDEGEEDVCKSTPNTSTDEVEVVASDKDVDQLVSEVSKGVEDCEVMEVKKNNVGDGDEIVEVPIVKKPTVVVDLANDEDASDKTQQQFESNDESEELNSDGNKRIKLRSLASLVDNRTEDPPSTLVSTSHPDIPAIGEIVEHGVIIGSDEMDGLGLRISNVVGGEDCITGLTIDEDRDTFSSIQISSVTTLMDPMSPEDPNKENDTSSKPVENEKNSTNEGVAAEGESESEKTTTENSEKPSEGSPDKGVQDVDSENVASKEDANKSIESAGTDPQLTPFTVASKADVTSNETRCVYHVLRSILTVNRECFVCSKSKQCEFRVTKKGESGSWAFLCTTECRTQWTVSLPTDHQIEKPRLIFEKLCGMCGKDLASVTRSGQFSWETREFCSRKCLTLHLTEVASECHMCHDEVRPMFIGKYCVRFGSDIHQFCSNVCLERYKTKIKVCCYCQKNLDKVKRVSSMANKEYCSMKCLKRAQRRDIGQQNYNEHHPCTVCVTNGPNRYEFLSNKENFQLCSDPCLNVYKYANRVKAVSCCLCFRVMNAEDVGHYLYHGGHQLRVFCSDSCVNVFILSARKIVVCNYCKVKKYNFDMIHRQEDEDFRDYFYCSLNCLTSKEPALGTGQKKSSSDVSASTTVANGSKPSESADAPPTTCNMCSNLAKPQYHMVMSDNTLRSFCRYACASKYKNTYGFQINGIQNSDSTQPSNSISILRPKSTQSTANTTEDGDSASKTKPVKVNDVTQGTANASAELLKILTPPIMVNKMTSCRPSTLTKGVYCKPHPWHRFTQTDKETDEKSDAPPIIPVPLPVYVPAPMMMYSHPFPVPIFVPIPVPVPIFIPTTAKNIDDLKKKMKKIQEDIPADPYEAEMLLLARASSENVEKEEEEEEKEKEEKEKEKEKEKEMEQSTESVNNTAQAGCGGEEGGDDMQCVNVSCLDTIEDDLPRYPLRLTSEDTEVLSGCGGEVQTPGENDRKRRAPASPTVSPPSKRHCSNSDDFHPWYDSDDRQSDLDCTPELEPELILDQEPECEADPEPFIEEFQGPFLNKVYGLAAWKHWVTEKNAELSGVSSSRSMKLFAEDLLTMNCEELNYALCLFLKDIRKPNGEAYQPDTIFYMLLGIQQHLFDSSRTDCIFMDFGFEKFTNCFDEITKTFLSQSLSSGETFRSEAGVTRVTETMLWECRQLGAHTPQVLLNTLFYFNTKVFKLKTVEDHQALSFAQIVKQWKRSTVGQDCSVTRTILLKYYPKKSGGDSKVKRPFEMHENRDDPLRCPVKLYEFYLSKCPETVRCQRNMYYVYPERSCVPDSPTWFSTQTVQAPNLAKMLNRALMVREVQEALGE